MYEKKEKKEFKLAPEGTYILEVVNIMPKASKKGGNFDSVQFKVATGQHEGVNMFECIFKDFPSNPNVVKFGQEKKQRIFEAMNLSKLADLSSCVGKHVVGEVREEVGSDGITRNKIMKFSPVPKEAKMPEQELENLGDIPF